MSLYVVLFSSCIDSSGFAYFNNNNNNNIINKIIYKYEYAWIIIKVTSRLSMKMTHHYCANILLTIYAGLVVGGGGRGGGVRGEERGEGGEEEGVE